ncbi:MAG TPA: hypothetical protein VE553_10280, partial [Candidatus Binatia bacterium]|nr:hypothetical protein [Candidatus Binatia bacterium]
MSSRLTGFIASIRSPLPSLRRRILVGNAFVAILLLLAAAIVALQVRQLVAAVRTLEEAGIHVDAAVSVRQQTTDLMATVSRLLPEQNGEQFADEVAVRLDALKASQQEMLVVAQAVDDPSTSEALQAVNSEVTNVTNI